MTSRRLLGLPVGCVLVLAGCSLDPDPGRSERDRARTESASATSSQEPMPAPTPTPTTPTPTTAAPSTDVPRAVPSDGRARLATMSIPSIEVTGLRVVPYRGTTDDGPGSRIQDGGVAASPGGPAGGVGPGGIGNYLVTAHRTSSTRAFARTPELRSGDRVRVDVGGTRYVYEIVRTRWTSFRSPDSLAAQRAAVPGRPGVRPSRAMITLSTCATQEDHAAGNFWSDEHHNPEHRIDKIGVLVATTAR